MKIFEHHKLYWLFVALFLKKPIVGEIEDPKLILISSIGERVEVHGSECTLGVYFQIPKQFKCACVTGIWALYKSWCSAPVLLIGGSNYCFQVTDFKVTQASLLSSSLSTLTPSIARMSSNMEQLRDVASGNESKVYWNPRHASFITFGASEWELVALNRGSRCLKHASNASTSYCYFSNVGQNKITRVTTGCRASTQIYIEPNNCVPFVYKNPNGENFCLKEYIQAESGTLSIDPIQIGSEDMRLEKNVVRRNDPEETSTESESKVPTFVNPMEEEPSIREKQLQENISNLNKEDLLKVYLPVSTNGVGKPDDLQMIIDDSQIMSSTDQIEEVDIENALTEILPPLVECNPIILNYLSGHVESQIRALVGNPSDVKAEKIWPVVKVMELTMKVMERTCHVLSPNFLELALRTFVDLQIESLHIKEPFISHATFVRIQKALTSCYTSATPHNFVINGTMVRGTSSDTNGCGHERKNVSDEILKNGKTHKLTMPMDRRGNGFEPIIETVWKILVNAHSYCYRYFSDYFNDHHSYTVSLMPLFTNAIQSIWMPPSHKGEYVDPGTGSLLYGGLLGDHEDLLLKLDMCVAASRVGSAYPWHMNRPPRDESNRWRRKRAATSTVPGQYCLKSSQDFESVLKLPRCNKL